MKTPMLFTVPGFFLLAFIGARFLPAPSITLPPPVTGSPAADVIPETIRMRQIEVKLNAIHHAHVEHLSVLEKESSSRVEAIIQRYLQGVCAASREAADPFQGIKNTGHTGMLYAADMVTNSARHVPRVTVKPTNYLEQYTIEAVAPVCRLLATAHAEVSSEVDRHLNDVRHIQNQYLKETLVLANAAEFSAADIALPDFKSFEREYTKTSRRNFSASLSTSLEAALIYFTYAQIRKVLVVVAAKMSKTAGAAIVTAAADGPLPVGDIIAAVIAAGGLVWTGYDIYRAAEQQKNLPGEIASHTRKSLDSIRTSAMNVFAESSSSEHLPQPIVNIQP